ncbi:hypothetical protein ACIQAC_08525 [Streptomyces sp. NPDC088387]|uniref:hypothetical protein n=1 Tax=Streptomyces sp. NPDC088387 TaxID=3365859 RepID=UPI0037FE9AB0
MTGIGVEVGAQAARARALAVLRVRSRALAVALLPAAAAVILLAGGSSGHLVGHAWDVARWVMSVLAVLVLAAAGGVALVVARARPAVTPTVTIAEDSAPDLYRMVRDLADRLDVPAPSAIALTPDCDSWLEDRTHPAHGTPAHGTPPPADADEPAGTGRAQRRSATAPVLVIGSPFLWWMRVGELRAVLAPVVAGTGPSAQPDIAAARRFVRGLDAAVAVAATPGRNPVAGVFLAGVGRVARLLLHSCRVHAAEMERGVAAAAAERAQAVDYGLRIVAQEQVGLAYAGWDRLLTRVALPAWRMGRWPSRLDAGVVAALTELSRRDRLAEGFTSRLGERPACDLLEEPGAIDEATSLLAARLFHGGPAEPGPDWSPVDWQEYPEEVVDRKWRIDAARLHRVLDALGVRRTDRHSDAPTLDRVLNHLANPAPPHTDAPESRPGVTHPAARNLPGEDLRENDLPDGGLPDGGLPDGGLPDGGLSRDDLFDDEDHPLSTPRSTTLADRLSAELTREEAATAATTAARAATAAGASPTASPTPGATAEAATGTTAATGRADHHTRTPDADLWDIGALPLFPLQPPRSPRELLADHVTAMVCCAAMDTAGAKPGLDWLDGPSLMFGGERAADLTPKVLSLLEHGDQAPLRSWLTKVGIRPEKPVRLV